MDWRSHRSGLQCTLIRATQARDVPFDYHAVRASPPICWQGSSSLADLFRLNPPAPVLPGSQKPSSDGSNGSMVKLSGKKSSFSCVILCHGCGPAKPGSVPFLPCKAIKQRQGSFLTTSSQHASRLTQPGCLATVRQAASSLFFANRNATLLANHGVQVI